MSRLFRIVAVFVALGIGSMACNISDPCVEGGSEANAEEGLEAIIETQGAINNAADAVWEAADGAAEALSIAPDGSVAETIEDSSPHLLEQAAALAKRVAKYDACMKDCDSEDSGCHRNCEILWIE